MKYLRDYRKKALYPYNLQIYKITHNNEKIEVD